MNIGISSVQARYLKHEARKIDVKVTLAFTKYGVEIHIRDMVFTSYNRARRYIQHIGETELGGVSTVLGVQS